jgi:hypothetical protein
MFSVPVLVVGLVGCNSDGRTLRPARPDQTGSVYTTTTTSTVPVEADAGAALDPALETPALAFVLNLPWEEGGAIDPRYTCDGADIQPGVSWLGAPADAVEMALVVTDTDADDFVHRRELGADRGDRGNERLRRCARWCGDIDHRSRFARRRRPRDRLAWAVPAGRYEPPLPVQPVRARPAPRATDRVRGGRHDRRDRRSSALGDAPNWCLSRNLITS